MPSRFNPVIMSLSATTIGDSVGEGAQGEVGDVDQQARIEGLSPGGTGQDDGAGPGRELSGLGGHGEGLGVHAAGGDGQLEQTVITCPGGGDDGGVAIGGVECKTLPEAEQNFRSLTITPRE